MTIVYPFRQKGDHLGAWHGGLDRIRHRNADGAADGDDAECSAEQTYRGGWDGRRRYSDPGIDLET